MTNPIPGNRFSTRLIDRLVYAHDASLYRLVPKAVARPKDEQEVRALFHYANSTHTALTFRTGGTSLSGQAVTEGVIVEVIQNWKSYSIEEKGSVVTVEPGLTGEFVNTMLKPYGMRLGPDPASIKAARIGGIFSNNASGMCCGVKHNSYHTLRHIRFMLVNGHIYDTRIESDYDRFIEEEKTLADGLLDQKAFILENKKLLDRITDKYERKNTLGYGLNALVDFDHPLDIFSHLLVGAEGTLGFVSNISYNTIPDPGEKATALLIFSSIQDACKTIPSLALLNADAIELMDYASLTTAKYLDNPPYEIEELPKGAAALLVEFQRHDVSELEKVVSQVLQEAEHWNVHIPGGFQIDDNTRQKLWQIRKSLYPTVGSLRKTGTSVITEDICFEVEKLPAVITDLQNLFEKWSYDDAVIFGHAKDGNLHFVTSIDLETEEGIKNYEGFMDELVSITSGKYSGALKAEHGTGRNMAPFVETEWGGELAEVMWTIKRLADPKNILNPDVLLTQDKKAHVSSLKPMPLVNDTVDLCVECGFCEPVCPSRELTLTPRHRIALAREIELLKKSGSPDLQYVMKELPYQFSATCAVDGLCESACPVNINTGQFVKEFRYENHSGLGHSIAGWMVKHFPFVQGLIRFFIHIIHWKSKLLGHGFFTGFTKLIRSIFRVEVPVWSGYIPNSAKWTPQKQHINQPDYIYFPSCISRVFAADDNRQSLQEIILSIAQYNGERMIIPKSIDSLCCGTPFQSKGYNDAYRDMIEQTINELYVETDGGKIPVVVDTSPCAFQFISAEKGLSEETRKKWVAITFLDIVPFLHSMVEISKNPPLDESIVLHPTCSSRKMEDVDTMISLARKCTKHVVVPDQMECCGYAGDRGLLVPELTKSSVSMEKDMTAVHHVNQGYSSSRMCEVGMSEGMDIPYRSIALLVQKYLNS